MSDDSTTANPIYIVEQGSYSDYSVLGIFTTREKAEEYAKRYNMRRNSPVYDDATVGEMELDPEIDIPRLQYQVWVFGKDNDPMFRAEEKPRYVPYTAHVYLNYYGNWGGSTAGDTPEQAMKNAHDQVAKEKALALERSHEELSVRLNFIQNVHQGWRGEH